MGKLNSEKHGKRIGIHIESKSSLEEHCDDLLQFVQLKKKKSWKSVTFSKVAG